MADKILLVSAMMSSSAITSSVLCTSCYADRHFSLCTHQSRSTCFHSIASISHGDTLEYHALCILYVHCTLAFHE